MDRGLWLGRRGRCHLLDGAGRWSYGISYSGADHCSPILSWHREHGRTGPICRRRGWGVAEGAYLELPVFGPSNLRDGFARFVDMLLLDPAGQILKPPVSKYRTASNMGAILQKRQIYGAQIDEVLYGSADSYAQARLVYLQSRRFELKDIANDAYIDPYAEFE